ncbi:Kae1-associated kinase Bud32 [Archaeoglobus sulfaticallidus PM70-1]|uniref:non-specific serine/threonine protein kinase n=1 Tax=Archaeoglobus sulfaticallidus PM70-1 TaxID=387631 RepID=N0BD07_9EURY|nr:Kae1-associated kinase Bud32 [Archaeoglobus sulfaticallidus]AGK60117.1 Kae1-associated kinase Bud32 [Archaeoglobus sulfaticallidus PM70-1]
MIVYLGGEAEVRIFEDVVHKIRRRKRYRIEKLDSILRKSRVKTEVNIIASARRCGVPTPIVLDVDGYTIIMERIKGTPLKEIMNEELSREVGRLTAKLHRKGIIHGDITPMNLIYKDGRVYFIDFGLSFYDDRIEPKGVDVHIYFESLKAYFENWIDLKEAFISGYREYEKAEEVLKRAAEIEERGRYVERRMM